MGTASTAERHRLPQGVRDDVAIGLTCSPEVRTRPTRVLVAHETRLFADVLRVALSERTALEVLPSIPALADAVEVARRSRPDVIIMDLESRTADGLEVLKALRAALPDCFVLIVTSSVDAETLPAAMSAGASGYLTMDADMSDVVDAIRTTAAGQVVLSGSRLEALVRHLSGQSRPVAASKGLLTDRERDVLVLLVDGQSTVSIAKHLGVSHNTARTHIQNVLTKLGVHSRLEAVARAVRERLV